MARKNKHDEEKRPFTGLYDDFPEELTDKYAWAYAAIYRHCMMREGICRASQITLAKESRMTRSRFRRAQIWLIQNDYVIDQTPDNNASCHTLEINDWKIDNKQDDKPMAENKNQDDDEDWFDPNWPPKESKDNNPKPVNESDDPEDMDADWGV